MFCLPVRQMETKLWPLDLGSSLVSENEKVQSVSASMNHLYEKSAKCDVNAAGPGAGKFSAITPPPSQEAIPRSPDYVVDHLQQRNLRLRLQSGPPPASGLSWRRSSSNTSTHQPITQATPVSAVKA